MVATRGYMTDVLTDAALAVLAELDEDTIEWRPTYDGESTEPAYLPAMLPNLLVNGTSGIAVGMATNMPTHNLVEIYEAIKLVMTRRQPRPTLDELMELVPGPDFPSGGMVIDEGLKGGEQVIVQGLQLVRPGISVKATDMPAPLSPTN